MREEDINVLEKRYSMRRISEEDTVHATFIFMKNV